VVRPEADASTTPAQDQGGGGGGKADATEAERLIAHLSLFTHRSKARRQGASSSEGKFECT
jgi:hypothetical protein